MKSSLTAIAALAVATAGCGPLGELGSPFDDDDPPASPFAPSDTAAQVPIVQVLKLTTVATDRMDHNLINPWGLAFSPSGPAWIADYGTGRTSMVDAHGALALSLTLPFHMVRDNIHKHVERPARPTGVAWNEDDSAFSGDKLIFVTDDGRISGWQSGPGAVARVDNSPLHAVYKGAAIARASDGTTRLFVTNFHAGTIDVFDEQYRHVHPSGAFNDMAMPRGFAPFNVYAARGMLFVTYAHQDTATQDVVCGLGEGFLNAFDTDGNLLHRLAVGGTLNAPWGMTFTPEYFGNIGDKLLVGNTGDGHINVFGIEMENKGMTAVFDGYIGQTTEHPMVIDGLHALHFAPERSGFAADQLYFTAAPKGGKHGMVGRLSLP
jgi:uncharacterized protein (TIGR03118 family)